MTVRYAEADAATAHAVQCPKGGLTARRCHRLEEQTGPGIT